MGRLFDKETNKTSSPTSTKGRLFTAPTPKKKTLGEKVNDVAIKIGNNVIEGVKNPLKRLSEYTPDNRQTGIISGRVTDAAPEEKTAAKEKFMNFALSIDGGGGNAIGRIFKGGAAKNLAQKATGIIEEAIPSVPKVLTPVEKQAAYSKKMGYEPIVPNEQLPTIPAGITPKSDLPIVQTGEKTPKRLGSYEYEPIKDTPVSTDIPAPKPRAVTTKFDNSFERQSNSQQIDTILKQGDQHVEDVVLRGAKPVDNIPKEAYLSVLQNKADELALTGDTSLAEKLSTSNIFRKAGQGLQAASITSKEGLTGLLREVRTQLEDTLPKSTKRMKDREVSRIQQQLKEALDSFDTVTPKKQSLLEAVELLRCK